MRHPGGPGAALVDAKNAAGRTPLGEAETAEWDEGARWLVEVMDLGADEGGAPEALGKEVDDEGEGAGVQDVEVEITDAEGGIAKMSLGRTAPAPTDGGAEG